MYGQLHQNHATGGSLGLFIILQSIELIVQKYKQFVCFVTLQPKAGNYSSLSKNNIST
jgi:hypothetical protein